jgi:hypothetical protein
MAWGGGELDNHTGKASMRTKMHVAANKKAGRLTSLFICSVPITVSPV